MPDDSHSDPLNLDAVDRDIRIEKLRREIEDVTGTEMIAGKVHEVDPKLEEAFLENVLAVEEHGFACPLDVLLKAGFPLPPAAELDDATLTARLWELIRELAKRRLFLHSTDHLSDRELYAWLLTDALKEEMMGFGLPFGNCHLDVLGSGSEEDIILQMRYYADDEERKRWLKNFPDFPMPPKEPRPYDRDRLLPKSEF